MAHPSDPAFLVLHALRLKEQAGDELVVRRDGRISGWSLTPAGRARHAELVRDELQAAGARDDVQSAYDRFLHINNDMLAVCTAWQLRDVDGVQAINDHADAGYDAGVVQQLVGIHDRVRPVTADLRELMDRFSAYGDRLRAALEKVAAGESEWFTKPVIDSYHTIWFELHEDLLCTLGIERSSEGHT